MMGGGGGGGGGGETLTELSLALRDLETATFTQQDIFERHSHILKEHFHVTFRRVVNPKGLQWPHERDASRLDRHQDLGLLRMRRSGWVGLPHQDHNLTMKRAKSCCPPLAAVDHVPAITMRYRNARTSACMR